MKYAIDEISKPLRGSPYYIGAAVKLVRIHSVTRSYQPLRRGVDNGQRRVTV